MPGSPVEGRHKRYRTGTNTVITWLARTAARYGKLRDIVPRWTGNTKELTTRQIVILAEQIESSARQNSARISELHDMIITCEDVVKSRQEHGKFNEGQKTQKPARQPDRQHGHFVNAFRTVLNCLRAVGHAIRGPKPQLENDELRKRLRSRTSTSSRNAYSLLELQQTLNQDMAEEFSNLTLEQSDQKSQIDSAALKTTFELEATEGEDEFALWCLLKEGEQIREHLRVVWQRYLGSEISLQVAAEVTDKAFQIFQHLADDFVSEFPNLSSFEQIADHLDFTITSVGQDLDEFSYTESGRKDSTQESAWSTADLLCAPAYLCLLLLRRAWDAKDSSDLDYWDYESAVNGKYGLARSWWNIEIIYAQYAAHLERTLETIGLDTFSGYLLDFVKAKTLPVHIVVAFQIYMDIVDRIMGSPWPRLHLIEAGALCTAVLDREDAAPAYSVDSHLQPVRPQQSQALNCLRDSINQAIMTRRDRTKALSMQEAFDTSWLKPLHYSFPVLCGVQASSILHLAYLDGIQSCNDGFFVIGMAHLYYACKKLRLLSIVWPDMELVVKHIGPSKLGLGDLNATSVSASTLAKQFGLALGVSVTSFSRDTDRQRTGTRRPPLPSLRGMLKHKFKIVPTSPFVQAMRDRGEASNLFGAEPHKSLGYALHQMVKRLVADSPGSIDPDLMEQWATHEKLQPTQLLEVIEIGIASAEIPVLFDYRGFVRLCATWLDYMRAALNEFGVSQPITQPSDRRSVAAEVVYEALWSQGRVTHSSSRPSLLRTFAQLMEENLISKDGSQFSKRAQHRQSLQLCRPLEEEDRAREAAKFARQSEELPVSVRINGSKITVSPMD